MLIAITGKAGAGKDTAANHLFSKFGFVSLPFAEALKDSVKVKFGLSDFDVYEQEGKRRFVPEWGLTVGEILQREGTEATRGYWGDDFWIKRWQMSYEAHLEYDFHRIVVPDCRFDNEAEHVSALGGKVIQIERPNAPELEGRDPNHPSEQGIDPALVGKVIVNDASVSALKLLVEQQVREWMNG